MDMRAHVILEPTTAAVRALEGVRGVSLGWGPDLPGEVDVLVAGRPSVEALHRTRRALVIPWTGLAVQTRDRLLARAPDLRVYNLHHAAAPVAELAVALLLAASRRLVPMDRSLRAGDWRPRYAPDPGLCLEGGRALVLGLGAIGSRVARALQGLGMEVVGIRRREPPTLQDLPELLPTADALVLCLPATPRTVGLIGAEELALLPARAVLVNVARADLVDESALFAALSSERLHGAGLDVWWRYPGDTAAREHTAPSRFDFASLDRVVMSPHRAGHGEAAERARVAGIVQALEALRDGREPPHRVDVQAGY